MKKIISSKNVVDTLNISDSAEVNYQQCCGAGAGGAEIISAVSLEDATMKISSFLPQLVLF